MCDVHICLHNLHSFMRPIYMYIYTYNVYAVYVNVTQHIPFQVRSSNCEDRQLPSSQPSVPRPPAWNHSTPTAQFMIFDTEYFFRKSVEKLSFIKIWQLSNEVFNHTQLYFSLNVYYLAPVSTASIGHHQAIVQEHKWIQKLNTMRQEICPFTLRIHLKCMYSVWRYN